MGNYDEFDLDIMKNTEGQVEGRTSSTVCTQILTETIILTTSSWTANDECLSNTCNTGSNACITGDCQTGSLCNSYCGSAC